MNKNVWITGGNKGIGLDTTHLFLEHGDTVTVIARDFSSFPYKLHKKVQTVSFDVSNVAEIPALASALGSPDILINNAGVMYSIPYDVYPEEKQQMLMNVNLYAPIAFITAVSGHMKEQNFGRIVNVASVAGQIGHPDIWYGVSKAGIINATKSFAKIFSGKNITVNAVAPGPTETDMLTVIPEARKTAILNSVYSGRFAKPEEIAKTVFWLAADAPEYINGVCIDMNNGSFPR